MHSTVQLTQQMQFDVEVDGHHFPIDAKEEHGGQNAGATPKALMLSALAGCASMDVISVLRKMRAEPASLKVTASAELTDTHPRVFTGMAVRIEATGGIPTKKLWRAVSLSRDRYCGVAAMMRAHGPISYTVVLDGAEVPEPVTDI